jgi:hypothetical protein
MPAMSASLTFATLAIPLRPLAKPGFRTLEETEGSFSGCEKGERTKLEITFVNYDV